LSYALEVTGRLFPFKEGTVKKIAIYCQQRRQEHQQRQSKYPPKSVSPKLFKKKKYQ